MGTSRPTRCVRLHATILPDTPHHLTPLKPSGVHVCVHLVKHPKDRYPFYDELSAEFYGSEDAWVLLKHKTKLNH